ncbi:MAG: polyprenyl synthetase family protein [Chloroflexia bacterium]
MQSTHDIDPIGGDFTQDIVLTEVDDALKATLRRYSSTLPTSLINIGKTALGAAGKVMHWRAVTDSGRVAPIANWPLIVLRGFRAVSSPQDRNDWRRALSAAVSVEIMVAATDLIDEWSDGDPSAVISLYGPGQALNTASLMLVMSQQVLVWAAQEGEERALPALGALQDLLTEAAVGQHLDMMYEGMGLDEVTPQMSGDMSEKKAGALISGALKMGGLMAGASPDVLALLERFGRRLGGIAQTANDIRDVLPRSMTGDISGLPTGNPKTDIGRRKRTLPIVYTLREENDAPNALQLAFGAPRADDEDDELLRQVIADVGGIEFAGMALEWYRQDAAEALTELEALSLGAQNELSFLL